MMGTDGKRESRESMQSAKLDNNDDEIIHMSDMPLQKIKKQTNKDSDCYKAQSNY